LDEVYDKINAAWKKTCSIVLGDEVCDLEKARSVFDHKLPVEKYSSVSNKPVYLAQWYEPIDHVVGYEDIDKIRKTKFSLDEIKDIDSIFDRVQEIGYFAGSLIQGNSQHVVKSDRITDSQYILASFQCASGEHVAFSNNALFSKYIFFVNACANSSFVLSARCFGGKRGCNRCLEIYECADCSDTYYSTNCTGCVETFFSFFQTGRRYCIGNHQLERDKYLKIKSSLLEQIRDNIMKSKHVCLFDLFSKEHSLTAERASTIEFVRKQLKPIPDSFDKTLVQRAFDSTCRVILGSEVGDLDDFSQYLTNKSFAYSYAHIDSVISGKPTRVPYRLCFKREPKNAADVFVKEEEYEVLKQVRLDEKEIDELSISHDHLHDTQHILSKIFFVSSEFNYESKNVDLPIVTYSSRNIYRCNHMVMAENAAFCNRPRNSKFVFGGEFVLLSNYVINVHFSEQITRGFEVDTCKNCADIYFSHNCEGCFNTMFSFHQRGKRYMVGNNVLSKEEYDKLTSHLKEQIVDRLVEYKTLDHTIYDLMGCSTK